jgi:hypothetical protein
MAVFQAIHRSRIPHTLNVSSIKGSEAIPTGASEPFFFDQKQET